MPHSDFVHLHLHTQFSLLDGACRLHDLLNLAQHYKMDSLAITDHGNMFGAIDFYLEAQKAGVKPIIGCEAYIAPGSRLEKTLQGVEEAAYHLILLAKDETGYRNLMKLVSIAFLEGFYYKPRIDKEVLAKYSKGLIGLTACLKGEIPSLLQQKRFNDALKAADELNNIFGKGNFYLELQENLIPEQAVVNEGLIRISRELGLPLAATNDVHYLSREHARSHEALLCIQTQTTLDDPKRLKLQTDEFYFKSPEEMKKLFHYCPQAVANTLEIAGRCNLEMDFSSIHLPKYDPPEGKSKEDYLRQLCENGLKERFAPEINSPLRERLEYELKIIRNMGFTSYFLIVWDFIHYAKSKGIPVGPGRGSAAGSLVSYLLGITDIDPIKYGLLFERFLNPERMGLPDIDIDFCYERRPEVIEYVTNKYGRENVAQIITFGTMQARAVVRDVGRVMGIAYADVDRLAKMIPPDPNISLKEALNTEVELNNLYKNDSQITQLVNTAIALEGLNRHASIHAAGVVIADKPLDSYSPLFKTQDEQITTGYSMGVLDRIGLLKMDFLGLRTLTVIDETIKIVKQTRQSQIDIKNIPLDDPNTYKLLGSAQTMGVFQVESSGMRDLLRKLEPERFEDLIALLALYRPGPIGSGMLDDFIKRKHNLVPVKYEHPKLEGILKETYGIMVYQEQIMQIASALGGFSLAQADILRKAMGKKIPEVMEKQRKNFVVGCMKNGIKEFTATKIFDLIEYFSGYGFNKCVVGSTKIIDADTGKSITVQELFENSRLVKTTFSYDDSLKVVSSNISDVVHNGIKPTYKVKTALGREIIVTSNHPFLTFSGWKNLEDLKVGEKLATCEQWPFIKQSTKNLAMTQTYCHCEEAASLSSTVGSGRRSNLMNNWASEDYTPVGIASLAEYNPAGLGRLTRNDASEIFPEPELSCDLTGARVVWDRIISIEYAGLQNTYDLEIEHTHNFVANGFIVHNSHSTAYALISYRTAYLKANYPVEFMTALLTSERNNTDKIVEYVNEASRMGIEILPPDINESGALFKVVNDKTIRFGLLAIKNVGAGAIESIIEARKTGKFRSLEHLCENIDLRLVNKKVMESLIKCGALDSFAMPRAQMAANLEKIVEHSSRTQKERLKGQLSFFDLGPQKNGFHNAKIDLPAIKEWPEPQILAFEKEMLGFYISGHPLARYAKQLKRFSSTTTANLSRHKDDEEIKIVGLIAKIKQTLTRAKQEKMAILKLEDLEGIVEALVFPQAFQKVSRYILPNTVVLAKGRLNLKEDTPKIIINDLLPMDAVYKLISAMNINLSGMQENLFLSLKELLLNHSGRTPVYLHLDTPTKARIQLVVGENLFVDPSEKLIQEIIDLMGEERLALAI